MASVCGMVKISQVVSRNIHINAENDTYAVETKPSFPTFDLTPCTHVL